MLTILSIIGTRPETIKMAPVIRELKRYPDQIRSQVCVTGQHREMLNSVLELFGIVPDFNLDVMELNQSLAQLTAKLIGALGRVVKETRPDWVLAQGDTTTVLAAALVAFYAKVRFGHIEAGLRTGDVTQPFPEEMNRNIADYLSTVLFAPTKRVRQSLLREGFSLEQIYVTGNTIVDALLDVSSRPFNWEQSVLPGLRDKHLVLITAHRRESFGNPLLEMCHAIRDLAQCVADRELQFVFPVHLNPNVQRPVFQILANLENVSLIEPVDYLTMVNLMKKAELILTDSGGIQEEAPSLGVPVLVMRDKTERPEGIEAGVVRLVGTERSRIVAEAEHLLRDSQSRAAMTGKVNPFGDGKAAIRIVATLLTYG
jgi:UDP-N-acetylglucosamine 2-epimerase